MDSSLFLVIMAGGSGTRFWPKSVAKRPKQLLGFGRESPDTLIVQTLKRFDGVVESSPERRFIVTTELLKAAIEEQVGTTKVNTLAESAGRYTLQVGSYPSLREAEPELLKLNENGLRGEVREVDLAGRGKWFRLFVGQFPSIKDAEKAGKNFKKERRISDFVVVRSPESAQNNH